MRRFVLEVDVAEPDQYLTVMARRAHEALGHRMAVSKVEDTEGAGDGWRWRMVEAEAAVSREAEGAGEARVEDDGGWIAMSGDGLYVILRRCSYIWRSGEQDPHAFNGSDGDIPFKGCLGAYKDHADAAIIIAEIQRRLAAYSRMTREAHVAAATGAASGEAASLRELLAKWERSANPDDNGNQALHALLFALVERIER